MDLKWQTDRKIAAGDGGEINVKFHLIIIVRNLNSGLDVEL